MAATVAGVYTVFSLSVTLFILVSERALLFYYYYNNNLLLSPVSVEMVPLSSSRDNKSTSKTKDTCNQCRKKLLTASW